MFLITGHSRCGTMYMAKLMHEFGFDVGHEAYKDDGISAWQLAPMDLTGQLLPWGCPVLRKQVHHLIQVVRDPFTAIPSIAFCDWSTKSCAHRERFISLPSGVSDIEGAALSLCRWNRLIEAQAPQVVVQVEHAAKTMARHLDQEPLKIPKPCNQRPHALLTPGEIVGKLSSETARELRRHCQQYGYEWRETNDD